MTDPEPIDVPLCPPTPPAMPELDPAYIRIWMRHRMWGDFTVGLADLMQLYLAGRPLPLVLAVKAVHVDTGVTTTVSFSLTDVASTDDMIEPGTFNHIGLYVPIARLPRPTAKPVISRTLRFAGFPSFATGGRQWWRYPIGPYIEPLPTRWRRRT